MRPIRSIVVAALAALAVAAPARAAWPEKPVHIVVAFPPGGATDVVARALAAKLSVRWNQAVVVDNRAGAGGNLGAGDVVKAAPDGYTLLLSSPAEIAINPSLYAQMPYDADVDLVPVARVSSAPLVLVVNAEHQTATTVPELLKAIAARPNGMTFASSGTGGPQHMAGEQFRVMTKAKLTHVPYKGGAPAITDLLGGQVDLFFAGVPPAIAHIKSGKLRALAVTTATRSSLVPNVPTLAESGLPGFDVPNWQGVFAPKGTPRELVERLATDIAAVAGDPEFVKTLTAQGAEPAVIGPVDFRRFVKSEREKYATLIKQAGVHIE